MQFGYEFIFYFAIKYGNTSHSEHISLTLGFGNKQSILNEVFYTYF